MSALEEDEYADESGEEGSEHEDDQFEAMLNNTRKDVWKDNLSQKNEIVRELIKCFGSMVESHAKEYAIPDHMGRFRPEDKNYEKLLDAPKFVTRAKR